MAEVAHSAGVASVAAAGAQVEIVRRRGEQGSFLFVINHSDEDITVGISGHDLVTDGPTDGAVPAGAVRIIKEDA